MGPAATTEIHVLPTIIVLPVSVPEHRNPATTPTPAPTTRATRCPVAYRRQTPSHATMATPARRMTFAPAVNAKERLFYAMTTTSAPTTVVTKHRAACFPATPKTVATETHAPRATSVTQPLKRASETRYHATMASCVQPIAAKRQPVARISQMFFLAQTETPVLPETYVRTANARRVT